MVTLDFGSAHIRRIKRSGRSYGSIAPSGELLPSPKKPNNKHLTQDQIRRLSLHQKKNKHTQKHMIFMRQLMLQGTSLKEAHKRAQLFVGK